ncbi:MAG: HEPN domain-containing protein [Nitrososphaera sp.]|uniref:HEPN domain-containing protein n=1 Tax=Nitrososphaera sp. TaxID=1971748 RepID=UPI003D6F36C4
MTRSVDPDKAANYLKKAEGSLHMARIAIKEGEFDSAVMNAVHSAITALDALTASRRSERASGSHTDVLSLIKGIFTADEYPDVEKQFTSLLGMKNTSEYQPELMNRQDAETAVKRAERLISRVKEKLRAGSEP